MHTKKCGQRKACIVEMSYDVSIIEEGMRWCIHRSQKPEKGFSVGAESQTKFYDRDKIVPPNPSVFHHQ